MALRHLATAALIVLVSAPMVQADLQFCNANSFSIHTSVGERKNGKRLASGWYHLAASSCKVIIGGDLEDEYYDAFAINSDEDYKVGGRASIVWPTPKPSTASGLMTAAKTAAGSRGFVEIDRDYRENIKVTFSSRREVQTSSSLDTRSSGRTASTTSGGSCTAEYAPFMICGDPDATATLRTANTGEEIRFFELTDKRSVVLAAAEVLGKLDSPNANPTIGISVLPFPDPHHNEGGWDAGEIFMMDQLYEPLVRVSPSGEIVGVLAESWELSDRQWTFNLRRGVTFHDGADVEANHVKASYERFKVNNSRSWMALGGEVTVASTHTICVRCRGAGAPGVPKRTGGGLCGQHFCGR